MPTDGAPLAVPAVVGGRFRLRGLLAAEGEAEVHLARDLDLDLDVVLKTRRIVDAADLERLRREASLLMRLVAHGGLPTVRSDLVDGDRYYLISDYVAGNDLRALVGAGEGGGLALATVLDLVDQLAATLDHLHGHAPPVVHGDVTPENVMVTADGRAILVDVGAAMRVGDDRTRLGTPGFAAPEVLAGEALTPAADVYSLSALTVFLLTGIVPKLGTSWPNAFAEYDLARLERIIRRGLTWDPLGRPWSASEFAQRLRQAAEMDVPTGTITFALADLSARDGSVAATTMAALEAAGGRQVSSVRLPGDHGLFAFARAGDAVGGALDAADGGAPIAVHAGDLGGRHGTTVQQLANETFGVLRGAARGAVACSLPVRMLLGGADRLAFEPLADGSTLVRRADIVATASPTATTEDPPTGTDRRPLGRRAASWLATRRVVGLAGRSAELATVASSVERMAANGVASLVVVLGDAGTGKTRFAAEVAGRRADGGELVFVGRCTESGGAFEPFLDALGDDVFGFESGQLERDEEGWIDRRRFFGRITAALSDLSQPVTLVLDDVQWIDGSSLALLAQLLDDLGDSLVVIAACRPGAPPEVLDQLTGWSGAVAVSMVPLGRADLGSLAEARGLSLPSDTIDGIHALSAGNPFFALQLLGHLADDPSHEFSSGSLPVGVREWILQRVDRLGERARGTLAPAAVVGRSFDVVVLADVLDESPLGVLGELDAAAAAGLLVDGEHAGEFRFVHAIVQSTLEASLSATRRGLLHAAVARRLEEEGQDLDHLEAAMHHWFSAGRLGDPIHAGHVAADVATRATERLAHERAVTIVDRALDVLAGAKATAERDRVEARLRLAHGRADFVASRNSEGIVQLYRAAALAEAADDPVTLAEAALVASLNRRHGLDDPELLRLLERASARCPAEPAVLRAMLHIRQSRLLPATVRHEHRSAMARLGLVDLELMDPVDRATVETEVARACWGPDDARTRLELTTRLVDDASHHLLEGGPSRWTGVLIEALNMRWAARMQLGDVRGALVDADRAAEIADRAGTTFLLSRVMMGQAMINATLGRHERAEQLTRDALAISSRHNLVLGQMAVTYAIGRDRGQQAELAALERQLGDLVDSNPMFVAAFALVHAEAGQHADARRMLGVLAEWAPWPRNWLWLATTTTALEAAVLVGDNGAARRYAAVLNRYSGQWAMAAGELVCMGPIDRVLGLARLAAGETDTAATLLTAARDAALGQGALPWVERADTALASLAGRSA
jgi:tRNA A-37 threonylcarbamoyl transferase component Bud32